MCLRQARCITLMIAAPSRSLTGITMVTWIFGSPTALRRVCAIYETTRQQITASLGSNWKAFPRKNVRLMHSGLESKSRLQTPMEKRPNDHKRSTAVTAFSASLPNGCTLDCNRIRLLRPLQCVGQARRKLNPFLALRPVNAGDWCNPRASRWKCPREKRPIQRWTQNPLLASH